MIESMIGKTSTQVEAEKEDASTSYLPFPLCTYVQNGEEGIRTLGEVSPTQHFQCCTFGRSVTSPRTNQVTRPILAGETTCFKGATGLPQCDGVAAQGLEAVRGDQVVPFDAQTANAGEV